VSKAYIIFFRLCTINNLLIQHLQFGYICYSKKNHNLSQGAAASLLIVIKPTHR